MRIILSILLFAGFIYSQFSFKKIKKLRWPISLTHVILKMNYTTKNSEFNRMLYPIKGEMIKKLNRNHFYLIKFQNYSSSAYIFQKQIDHLRRVSLILDVFPVLKYSGKFLSTNTYLNSNVSGFTVSKNDSLYTKIRKLGYNFRSCYERVFRLNPSIVRYLQIRFNIKNGRTSDLEILNTDIEISYLSCIKRVLNSEFWETKKKNGRVNFLFYLTSGK